MGEPLGERVGRPEQRRADREVHGAPTEPVVVDAEAVAFEGSAVDAILHFAEERHSNVVVIGGGGREGARDYLVGSTVERIVRHSPVPVLVIK
jgi:nucleotide-binding universal stress UspA family protein